MCLLITLVGVDPEHPIVVASNRDERRDRPSAPPGLHVGMRRRNLSPRDREAGGTWMGVNHRGLFVGLTNLAVAGPDPGSAPSRGGLPHAALDEDSVDAAAEAVLDAASRAAFRGFQLLVTDGERARVLTYASGEIEDRSFGPGPVVVTNEHRPGALHLPDLGAACAPELGLDVAAKRWVLVQRVKKLSGCLAAALPCLPRGLVIDIARINFDAIQFRRVADNAPNLFFESTVFQLLS